MCKLMSSNCYKGVIAPTLVLLKKPALHIRRTLPYLCKQPRNNFHHSRSTMDLFSSADHAKLYSKYRPTYPDSVLNSIIEFCNESQEAKFDTALDVGCGNGQSCAPLKQHFRNVIGVDVSESQIDQAKIANPDMTFLVGNGEDLSFQENDSVDLVTVAQAIHWMDTSKFYPEISRVLRPGGVLVAYGYGNCQLDNEEAQSIVWQFYSETLADYWDDRRRHIDNSLAKIPPPFDSPWRRNDSLCIQKEWAVDAFIGYLSSWSAWQQYLKTNPGSHILNNLRKRLISLYTEDCDKKEVLVKLKWPVFMLMERKSL